MLKGESVMKKFGIIFFLLCFGLIGGQLYASKEQMREIRLKKTEERLRKMRMADVEGKKAKKEKLAKENPLAANQRNLDLVVLVDRNRGDYSKENFNDANVTQLFLALRDKQIILTNGSVLIDLFKFLDSGEASNFFNDPSVRNFPNDYDIITIQLPNGKKTQFFLLIPQKYGHWFSDITKWAGWMDSPWTEEKDLPNLLKEDIKLVCNDINRSKDIIGAMEVVLDLLCIHEPSGEAFDIYMYLVGHGSGVSLQSQNALVADLTKDEVRKFLTLLGKKVPSKKIDLFMQKNLEGDQQDLSKTTLKEYQKKLSLKEVPLKYKYNVKMLFVKSCFVGSVNQLWFHGGKDMQEPLYSSDFLTVLSTAEAMTTSILRNFLNYIVFFAKAHNIANGDESLKSFLAYCSSLAEVSDKNAPHAEENLPLVVFPYGIKFDALSLNKIVKVVGNVLYTAKKLEMKPIIIKDVRAAIIYPSFLEGVSVDVYPSLIPVSKNLISGAPTTYLDRYYAICAERMVFGPTFDEMIVATFAEKYRSLKSDQFFGLKNITNDEIEAQLLNKYKNNDLWNYMNKNGYFKNLDIILARISWFYPVFIPQEKRNNTFYFSKIHVKNETGCIGHNFGVMKFIIDAFLRHSQGPSYGIPNRFFLIEELNGKNDLLGLLLMSSYIDGSSNDDIKKLKEKLENLGENNLTLKNVIIFIMDNKKFSIFFEYAGEDWLLNLCATEEDRKKNPWIVSSKSQKSVEDLFISMKKKNEKFYLKQQRGEGEEVQGKALGEQK